MTHHVRPSSVTTGAPSSATASIVTATYAPDFERCRLLCDTIDRFVAGQSVHYLLVEGGDVALFKQLESSRRVVIDERDLLPNWLRAYRDPTSLFKRRVWLSLRAKPLRGWHVQQLRRIAIAKAANDDNLVYCDSDVAFVRPFDVSAFTEDGKTRLFRRDFGLEAGATPDHHPWHENAARLLGIKQPEISPHDYITTLIAWRRETVLDMCAHIEAVNGKDWVESIAADRKFSECTIYGRYVDEIRNGADHFHSDGELCRVRWSGEPMSEGELRGFIDTMSADQVAIGVQSFIGTDTDAIRRVLGA